MSLLESAASLLHARRPAARPVARAPRHRAERATFAFGLLTTVAAQQELRRSLPSAPAAVGPAAPAAAR